MKEKNQTEVVDTQVITPDDLVKLVNDVIARLPEVPQVAAVTTQYAGRLGRVSQRVIDASLTAVATLPAVQSALGRTKDDVVQQSTDAVDWDVAIAAISRLYTMAVGANRRRRQSVGLTALQTYGICRQLVREAAHAEATTPHVVAMKQAMKKHKASTPAPSAPAGQ